MLILLCKKYENKCDKTISDILVLVLLLLSIICIYVTSVVIMNNYLLAYVKFAFLAKTYYEYKGED